MAPAAHPTRAHRPDVTLTAATAHGDSWEALEVAQVRLAVVGAPRPSALGLCRATLEEAFQNGEARLGPGERVSCLVTPARAGSELPAGDVATKGQRLELSAKPCLVPGVGSRASGGAAIELREPRLRPIREPGAL